MSLSVEHSGRRSCVVAISIDWGSMVAPGRSGFLHGRSHVRTLKRIERSLKRRFRPAMAVRRFGSGDIPAGTEATAAGLGAGRPESGAIAAAGRNIRAATRAISAGCGGSAGSVSIIRIPVPPRSHPGAHYSHRDAHHSHSGARHSPRGVHHSSGGVHHSDLHAPYSLRGAHHSRRGLHHLLRGGNVSARDANDARGGGSDVRRGANVSIPGANVPLRHGNVSPRGSNGMRRDQCLSNLGGNVQKSGAE